MSYIEKEKLIKADIASIENRVRHAFNQGYDLGYKEGKANRSEIPTGSTTKNDIEVEEMIRLVRESDVIDRTDGSVLAKAFNYLFDRYIEKPTAKNDLRVDCIYRAELLKAMDTWDKFGNVPNVGLIPLRTFELQDRYVPYVKYEDMANCVKNMPSVTPQEPQSFKWCTDCKEYDQEKHCCHRYSKVIRDTAEEMKQEPRWIPVSEYLPVTNDEVLVTYIVNGNAKKRYVETANCFDGEWSSVNDEYRIPNIKIEIIAWCEMPKPYKGESEDKG